MAARRIMVNGQARPTEHPPRRPVGGNFKGLYSKIRGSEAMHNSICLGCRIAKRNAALRIPIVTGASPLANRLLQWCTLTVVVLDRPNGLVHVNDSVKASAG